MFEGNIFQTALKNRKDSLRKSNCLKDAEGIVKQLDNNPNLKLSSSDSKSIFVKKEWSNNPNTELSGGDFNVKHHESKYLKGGRMIKFALPPNYDANKKYPVFYATDAGWNLFTVTN